MPPEAISTKECRGCGLLLPLDSFSRRAPSHDGLQPKCKRCISEYMAEYKRRNPNQYKEYIVRTLPHFMWRMTKKRARDRGLSFDLPESWFDERLSDGVCELTGVPFYIGTEPRHPLQPSPDRINSDPSIGYVVGNVRMVAYMVNVARQNYSDEVFAENFLLLADGLRRAS